MITDETFKMLRRQADDPDYRDCCGSHLEICLDEIEQLQKRISELEANDDI